ncbi:hypothetical protein L861_06395 [Litchfieldella anticariensis FP35 = DSM 16096]|uniref:ParB-like N-terminal domain-containing protein n=1 Tax=Litchfieldella anticariensis (strain DSM 16096 / CECT 5854 / CIP 108499 / LMG 22089 / FP35) TaxID=1121939 RepID=S2KJK0_LITA3|nr:ParB family protein [Halomonas anticariensis]EPC00563.1 hypothetical protein L861_06395 [Halomonas anticariensis FP35 = DSM 16096]
MSRLLAKDELTKKLLQPGPRLNTPRVDSLSAPNEEMGMSVTLDRIRPYDRNPRTQRNPKYDEIKESIRQVGLKHPPVISQRPGDDKYIICDGGNTRLQILQELYEETGDRRYFEFWCIFRPWVSEARVLAGHLAENDTRGNLMWVERAVKVLEARSIYEEEIGEELSNSELTRRLAADGYVIDRSLISRMAYTVEHFLPTIPQTLYSGMGKDQVAKLISYREACRLIWERCDQEVMPEDFAEAWHETLAWHDDEGQTVLAWNIVIDRLCGMLVDRTGVHYNIIELVLDNIVTFRKRRWDLEEHEAFLPLDDELTLKRDPDALPPTLYPPLPEEEHRSNPRTPDNDGPGVSSVQSNRATGEQCHDTSEIEADTSMPERESSQQQNNELTRLRKQVAQLQEEESQRADSSNDASTDMLLMPPPMADEEPATEAEPTDMPAGASLDERQARLQGQVLSEWQESPGKRGYRHYLAEQLGVATIDFERAAPLSIPLMSGDTTPPITDIWFIEGTHDSIRALRIQVREFAQAIARWGGFGGSEIVVPVEEGIGFDLIPLEDSPDRRSLLAWQALASLRGELNPEYPTDASLWGELLGTHGDDADCTWNDAILVRYFRLIRLIRRLRAHLHDNTGDEA